MDRRGIAAVLVLAGVLAGCGRGAAGVSAGSTGAGVAWEKDLAAALQRADGEGRLVMVDFYADWCHWCKVLEDKTLADASVQTTLRRMIAVKLDTDGDGRDAANRYQVEGLPTVLFLDGKGKEVGRIPGYMPPKQFLAELDAILKRV